MPELIEGKMVKGSSKAILMDIGGNQIWIPKSQIECLEGFKAVFAISDWIAWNKGLISDSVYQQRINERKNNQNKQKPSDVPEENEAFNGPDQLDLPF